MKYLSVANIIEARLKSGDYTLGGIPGERRIAQELGVSHMTSRRAVQHLIANGTLPKRPAGRISRAQARVRPETPLLIAFVAPAFDSIYPNRWFNTLSAIVAQRNGIVRHVAYVSPNDPVITDSLTGEFDGVFIQPPMGISPLLIGRLEANSHRVVTLFSDLTDQGIPCVDMNTPRSIWRIAEHFKSQGHRRVDCLNTQPSGPLIECRVTAWKEAAAKYGIETEVHDHAVDPFDYADERAHEVASSLLKDSRYQSVTGLFCTTAVAAMGVYRAAHEQKLVIGRHLSLATCDNIREAKLMAPSLTTLDNPSIAPFLARGVDWIMSEGRGWTGSLKIEPEQIPLWVGESIGLPCSRSF